MTISNDNWEMNGYLLGDPTIDRESFEQKMLDDPNFALQVAEAAELLEFLSVAAQSTQSKATQSTSPKSSTQTWKTALAAAATLLIAVASTFFFQGTQRRFDEVANSWLALERSQENIVSFGSEPSPDPSAGIGLEVELDLVSPDTGDEDWLIDSAIAFYNDSDR